MSWIHALRYRLRTFFRRRVTEAEREEEIRFHLALEEMQQSHDGLEGDEARLASTRRFGNVTGYRQEIRRMSVSDRIETAARQVRVALRGLRRSPGFSLAVVLTLGLGIGAVTAIGSLVYTVLLRPLPYPEADRLVGLWLDFPRLNLGNALPQSDATFFVQRRFNRIAEEVAVYSSREMSLTDPSRPERIQGAAVSHGFFTVLGISPLLGRGFSEEEDRPGGPSVVVVGERFWRRNLGADHNALGRPLQVDGVARQIVGVMPGSVALPDERAQLWIPLALDPDHTLPASQSYSAVARLRAGVSFETATQDFQQALQRLPEIYPDLGFATGMTTRQYLDLTGARPVVRPLSDDIVGDVGGLLWVLMGTALFVLLVAAANVASLFLVRAEARQGELAVRTALGANRSSAVAVFAVEGLLLAAAGAVLGLVLTVVSVQILAGNEAFLIPRLAELEVGGGTLLGTAFLTIALGLACALLPLGRTSFEHLATVLRSGGRSATGSRERHRVRQALVVGQVALAFALTVGAVLLARTFRELRAVEPGFDGAGVLALRVSVPSADYPTTADLARFHQQALERLGALPGVNAVGAASKLPLRTGAESRNSILVDGKSQELTTEMKPALIVFTGGEYFRAMGIPLIEGASFGQLDPDRPRTEAIVSAALATREWGSPAAAIGGRLRVTPTAPWFTVIGVVSDVRGEALSLAPEPAVYFGLNVSWPFLAGDTTTTFSDRARITSNVMNLVLRVAGKPVDLAGQARSAIATMDPRLPVYDVLPMEEVTAASMARTTFTAWLLAAAAGVALVLGLVGIYGLIAYTVSLRAREIGLRLALGARPADVDLMLVRGGLVLGVAGVGIGVALTSLLTGALRSLLFGVAPRDAITLIAVGVLMLAATLVAAWIPAQRASRLDPTVALSSE